MFFILSDLSPLNEVHFGLQDYDNESSSFASAAIGIAIGMLLGSTQKERKEIESVLREVHELRNALVHGNVERFELLMNERDSSNSSEGYALLKNNSDKVA